MTDPEPLAPHETRMLALQVAVEFVNGDARKASNWKAEEVVTIARVFEAYLTEEPIGDYVAGGAEDETAGGRR